MRERWAKVMSLLPYEPSPTVRIPSDERSPSICCWHCGLGLAVPSVTAQTLPLDAHVRAADAVASIASIASVASIAVPGRCKRRGCVPGIQQALTEAGTRNDSFLAAEAERTER